MPARLLLPLLLPWLLLLTPETRARPAARSPSAAASARGSGQGAQRRRPQPGTQEGGVRRRGPPGASRIPAFCRTAPLPCEYPIRPGRAPVPTRARQRPDGRAGEWGQETMPPLQRFPGPESRSREGRLGRSRGKIRAPGVEGERKEHWGRMRPKERHQGAPTHLYR